LSPLTIARRGRSLARALRALESSEISVNSVRDKI
jgi:hypothetical protein